MKQELPPTCSRLNRLLFLFTLALLAGLPMTHAAAQHHTVTRTVRGVVIDENGEPLPGAHVRQLPPVEGAPSAADATDADGHFTLTFGSDTRQIEVSFIGYDNQLVTLTARDEYRIRLTPSSELLNEVVVTGYQTLSRERATGSFAKINAEKLELKRPNTLGSLLEGEIAGYSRGLIRGTTSMNGMTTPLYVIDGFPVENTRYGTTGTLVEHLPELNIEDIESMTVLKDAAAASIYGARAANGVIVITTRKARQGRTQLSFSGTLTLQPYRYYTGNLADAATIVDIEREWAANNPNLRNADAATYAASLLSHGIYTTGGIRTLLQRFAGQLTQHEADDRLNRMAQAGYGYYDQVEQYAKRNALSQQYNIGIARSTDRNRFNASATYRNSLQTDIGSDRQSLGINLLNSLDLTSWLTVDLGSYLNYSGSHEQTYSPLSPGYSFQPYDRLVNDDGTPYTSPADERTSDSYRQTLAKHGLYSMHITPLDEAMMNRRRAVGFANRSYIKLVFRPLSWLSYSPQFQYEYGNDETTRLSDKRSIDVRSKVNGFATLDNDGTTRFNLPYGHIYDTEQQQLSAYNFRQQLDFNRTFGDRHDLTAILGSETRHTAIRFASNRLYNYDPDMLSYTAINGNALSSVSPILGGSNWSNNDMTVLREVVNRFVSFYGNAGYTYDGRYTATAGLRWDRSNLWGTNSKYQNKPLWSVGGSWNLYREAFFKVSWVDALKLRASYGIGGNIAKDAAPYMTARYANNYNVGGLYGSVVTRPNPELSWEKTTTANFGVDFALFRNRLSGTIEVYDKYGRDLLANTMGVPTEGFGYTTYKINNGEMRNRGIELSLSGDVVRSKEFSWNASLIYGYNKNTVTHVNVKAPVYILQLDYPQAYPLVGNPYSAIYAYRWAGLNGAGVPQVYDKAGKPTIDNPSSLDAIVYAGTTVPLYSGSFGSTFRYKNFDLSFLIVYEGGHKARNTFLPMLNGSYSGALNSYITTIGSGIHADIRHRWRKPGDEMHTDIPAAIFAESPDYRSDSRTIYNYADINVVDMSNLRLANVALAYRLPSAVMQRAGINNARIQLNVENAGTWARSRNAKFLLNGFDMPTFTAGLYLNL